MALMEMKLTLFRNPKESVLLTINLKRASKHSKKLEPKSLLKIWLKVMSK
jgi:hypothetical protein